MPDLQYICVDVANGYSEHFVHFVKDVREKFPSHTIMVSPPSWDCSSCTITVFLHRCFYFCQAGNVVTGEMVEELILAGADIIKVGIGPGDGGVVAINQMSPLSLKYTSWFFLHVFSQALCAPPARRQG